MTRLEDYIRGLSAMRYAAGWRIGIEYQLWAAFVGDRDHALTPGLSAGQYLDLGNLMRLQGGWLRADDKGNIVEVPIVEWMEHYVEWSRTPPA